MSRSADIQAGWLTHAEKREGEIEEESTTREESCYRSRVIFDVLMTPRRIAY